MTHVSGLTYEAAYLDQASCKRTTDLVAVLTNAVAMAGYGAAFEARDAEVFGQVRGFDGHVVECLLSCEQALIDPVLRR